MNYDIKIIREFLKIIETSLKFRGSPKGGGPASVYQANKIKPLKGKSDYDDLDEVPEEEPKKKIKVAKHLQDKEEDDHE
jgi:hypothetical protein